HQAIAGQRFRLRLRFRSRFFDQAHDLLVRRPGLQRGLRQATPPDFVTKAEAPCWMGHGQSHQPVAPFFFRTYDGAGLVIQCLARCQRTPGRASARGMAAPLARRDVSPSAYATSAAKDSVHRLVGLPKVRGLWCSSARNCSRCVALNAAWGGRWGAEERRGRAASPWGLKACRTLRTVWSSQPSASPITRAVWPRALASRI